MVLHSKLQKPLTCVHQASPGSVLAFEEEQMMIMMMIMKMLWVAVVVVVEVVIVVVRQQVKLQKSHLR